MREKERPRAVEFPGPRGLDPVPAVGGAVTVAHGPYAEQLPVGGLTVRQIRERFGDRFDIDSESIAVVDGAAATEDTLVRAGQVLTFVRHAGEKGSQAEFLFTDAEFAVLEASIGPGHVPGPATRRTATKNRGEMPVVTLQGDVAHVTSPEGLKAELGLDELLRHLLDKRMNTGEVILPDGVKWVDSRGRITIWVYQVPPRVHHLRWISEDSPTRFGKHSKYREVSISLPYLVVFAVFAPGRDGGMLISDFNECFFRNEPLGSLGDDLYYPALLNCSKFDPPDDKPLAWICSQHLDRSKSRKLSDENERMRQGLGELMHCLLEAGFNYSSEHHEGSSWFTESREVDTRIATVEDWQEASKAEPLFALDVPWLPVGKTVREVAQRIARKTGAGQRHKRTSRDVARVLYNHTANAKTGQR